MKLFPFQQKVLEITRGRNRVLYALDMGLGKTFVGSEKLIALDTKINLVVCQKSKLQDWLEHFRNEYQHIQTFDLTRDRENQMFRDWSHLSACQKIVAVINYDVVFRRAYIADMRDYTLILDESQYIRNEAAKRSKFVLQRMHPENVILLSGTPTSGKYEHLWSQCRLIGWNISKKAFWATYIETMWIEDRASGFRHEVVTGYKNVDRLKRKLEQHGAVFIKTEDVFDLPAQKEITINIENSKEYEQFIEHRYIVMDDKELVGDTILTMALYARQLCGQYSAAKLEAFSDLIGSTEQRVVVFYNFNMELEKLTEIADRHNRPCSVINGKGRNLAAYESSDNAVTFIQYQAGATGMNLQKSHITIYFTLPFGRGSCGLWEQSKKRTHRIGQDRACFYYYLIVKGSIEESNFRNLQTGVDYDEALFEKETL